MKKEHLNNMAISRRSLLKMFMASGISTALIRTSPLVSGLLYARHADAMDAGLPNKTVSIYIPGGSIASLWNPTGSGETMQLGVMSAGYEPVKTECNFMVNMAHSNAGHGRMPVLLAQSWGGDSYDVTMGNALGPNLPFRYLNLGVHSNGQGHLTKDNRNRLPFQENPFTVYKMVFGGARAATVKHLS